MSTPQYKILLCGDSCLTVQFEGGIQPETNRIALSLCEALTHSPIHGVVELVPTYRSVSVHYDPSIILYKTLYDRLRACIQGLHFHKKTIKRIIHIPVCYGGEFGVDLESTAAYLGLTAQELINRHSYPDYLIYMLGFLPGFAYLGGLEPTLAVPRLETPRTQIPAGSVGIGGQQTGIYPLASPGGWRLLGQTPVKPYDPEREEPFLYQAGDYIRFIPIDKTEFFRIRTLVDNNAYQCEIEEAAQCI